MKFRVIRKFTHCLIWSKWWSWDFNLSICLPSPDHQSLWHAKTLAVLRDHRKRRFGKEREEMMSTWCK